MADDFVGRIRFIDDSEAATRSAAANIKQMADQAVADINRVDQALQQLGSGGSPLALPSGGTSVGGNLFGGGGPLALGSGEGGGGGGLLALGSGSGFDPLALPPAGGTGFGGGDGAEAVADVLGELGDASGDLPIPTAAIGAYGVGTRIGAKKYPALERYTPENLIRRGYGNVKQSQAFQSAAASLRTPGGFAHAAAAGTVGIAAIAGAKYVSGALGETEELQELGGLSRGLGASVEETERLQEASDRLGVGMNDLIGNIGRLVEEFRAGTEAGNSFAAAIGLQQGEGILGAVERVQGLSLGLEGDDLEAAAESLGVDAATLRNLQAAQRVPTIRGQESKESIVSANRLQTARAEARDALRAPFGVEGETYVRDTASGVLEQVARGLGGGQGGFGEFLQREVSGIAQFATLGQFSPFAGSIERAEEERRSQTRRDELAQARVLARGRSATVEEARSAFGGPGIAEAFNRGPQGAVVNVQTQTTGNDFVERIYEVLQNYPYWQGIDGEVFDQ